jgi:low affinity Fe/Cu permease
MSNNLSAGQRDTQTAAQLRSRLQQPGFNPRFSHFAGQMASLVGSGPAFALAIASVVLWVVLGPTYHFSDTWQLVANTATNVITFVVVFLIQNTQNRDSRATHLKLDELLRVTRAHTELIDIENLSDSELDKLAHRYERIRAHWEQRRKARLSEQPNA